MNLKSSRRVATYWSSIRGDGRVMNQLYNLPKRRLVGPKQILPGSCWRIKPNFGWKLIEGWDCSDPLCTTNRTTLNIKPDDRFVILGLTRKFTLRSATLNGQRGEAVECAYVLFEGDRPFVLSLKTILRESLIVLRAPTQVGV